MLKSELPTALRQEWWAPLAALLAAFWFVVPTLFLLHGDGAIGDRLTVLCAWGSGLAIVVGLLERQRARRLGSLLILAGSAWSFLFYWMLLPYIAAVVVSVGVLCSGFINAGKRRHQPYRP